MHSIRLATFIIFSIGFSYAYANDVERGRILHNENCIKCHAAMYGGDGSTMYLREERHIESLKALNMQVKRCKNSLGLPWPEDQIDDLIAYLNATFYHFKNE